MDRRMKRKYEFRKNQRVRFKSDGREGVTVRLVGRFPQWLIEFDNGKTTFWWEADCEAVKTPRKRKNESDMRDCSYCKVSAVRYVVWHLWWCPLFRQWPDQIIKRGSRII